MSTLTPVTETPWLWHGWFARGHATLFSGQPKGGKTTLLSHLLRAFESGGDVGGIVSPARAHVVSEESESHWCRRRDALGIGDNVELLCRPFKGRCPATEWQAFCKTLGELVVSRRYDAVVIDTLAAIWPVGDENNASQVLAALGPLAHVAEAGAGLLLIHHPRKSEGDHGTAHRGSGALAGWPDILVELRRGAEPRQRVLLGLSRFGETPAELVIELSEDGEGYATLGTREDACQASRFAIVAELLGQRQPQGIAELLEAWPDESAPGRRTLERHLADAVARGLLIREGSGAAASPYRFRLPNAGEFTMREERF
jgi:hypothetical protein